VLARHRSPTDVRTGTALMKRKAAMSAKYVESSVQSLLRTPDTRGFSYARVNRRYKRGQTHNATATCRPAQRKSAGRAYRMGPISIAGRKVWTAFKSACGQWSPNREDECRAWRNKRSDPHPNARPEGVSTPAQAATGNNGAGRPRRRSATTSAMKSQGESPRLRQVSTTLASTATVREPCAVRVP